MTDIPHIGFPQPLLGREAIRLPVLFQDERLVVLMKPPGVLVQADPWYPRLPVLVEAIRHQAKQKKNELVRLGIPESGLWPVTDLDPECAGPVVFCRDREIAEGLKSRLGSHEFTFAYTLVCTGSGPSQSVDCDLPITRHRELPRMLVSHITGKKCRTEFTRNGGAGRYGIWVATTAFYRRHQIPLHAMESGIPILGDRHYARSHPPLLSSLKKDYRPKRDREERPLFGSAAYYLHSIRLPDGFLLMAPPPTRWLSSVRQLTKYSRPG